MGVVLPVGCGGAGRRHDGTVWLSSLARAVFLLLVNNVLLVGTEDDAPIACLRGASPNERALDLSPRRGGARRDVATGAWAVLHWL
jgi:hypothetical protein